MIYITSPPRLKPSLSFANLSLVPIISCLLLSLVILSLRHLVFLSPHPLILLFTAPPISCLSSISSPPSYVCLSLVRSSLFHLIPSPARLLSPCLLVPYPFVHFSIVPFSFVSCLYRLTPSCLTPSSSFINTLLITSSALSFVIFSARSLTPLSPHLLVPSPPTAHCFSPWPSSLLSHIPLVSYSPLL